MSPNMFLAGIPVRGDLAIELARRLRAADLDPTAGKLEHASAVEARILALEDDDRHALLRVMEDWCPPELGDLRSRTRATARMAPGSRPLAGL